MSVHDVLAQLEALLAELKRLREERDAAREALERYRQACLDLIALIRSRLP